VWRSFAYNLRFPGQYYDAETGLNYNYLRDYDPTVGRYVESDSIGLAGGSWSTYSYVNGNPLWSIDPQGTNAVAVADGIIVVGGAVIICSSTSICSDAVKAATNAIAQAASQCPKEKCGELQKEIDELVGELKSRQVAALVDKKELFTNQFFGRMSWMGHQWWYKNMVQPELAVKIAEAKALGCPYNPEADTMVSMPFPDAPVRWLSGPR
jgi:RHS repeat-associated protein